jgi:hypothetical protein
LDGSEHRTSVNANPNQQGGTSANVAYWDPGGVFNGHRVFTDALFDPNPFSGSPPFAFALTLRPTDVTVPATFALVGLGLASLGISRRKLSIKS